MNNEISIRDYLSEKGIAFLDRGKELVVKCIFSNCDQNSHGSEAHLYFSTETGLYDCKKCGAKGNIITLKKYLNDFPARKGGISQPSKNSEPEKKRNVKTITPSMVEKYHQSITPEIRTYLNGRAISDEMISKHKIGYGCFYGSNWIVIPIKDLYGNYLYFKLRQDPKAGKKKMTWPGGDAQIFDWNTLVTAKDKILICEGEMDALVMQSFGIDCITNTHGSGTFKEEWLENFNKELPYFVCYDNDDAGRNGAKKVAELLHKNGFKDINVITLPPEVGEKGDLGDYISRLNLPVEDLFTTYSKSYPEKIDVSSFKPITAEEIANILEPTIKKDDVNKLITTVALVNTYTEESQINIFFNAPSSTGKSHIPLSIADFFPEEDKIILANASPTAFIHEQGKFNKETNEIVVDLARKILIFTDMPSTELLMRMRSFLSHDQKESKSKITDKGEKGGNRTKTVTLIGYATVVFCSAGLRVDEQESTRCIVLSPSVEQDKLIAGIRQTILKEVDNEKFKNNLEHDDKRLAFKKRILAIKQERLADVKIANPEHIEKLYLHDVTKAVRPRQQRDIKKVICLIKGFAILNLWFREREGDYIYATEDDVLEAFKLWDAIALGQEHGLAP